MFGRAHAQHRLPRVAARDGSDGDCGHAAADVQQLRAQRHGRQLAVEAPEPEREHEPTGQGNADGHVGRNEHVDDF